jgi:hypothetical protein
MTYTFENTIIAQNYKIIDKIGEGSFGEVYRGVSLRNSIKVAIKIVELECNGIGTLYSK